MEDKKTLPLYIWKEEIENNIDTALDNLLVNLYKMYGIDITKRTIQPLQEEAYNTLVSEMGLLFQELIKQNYEGEVKTCTNEDNVLCQKCGKVLVDAEDNYEKGIGKICVKCFYDL